MKSPCREREDKINEVKLHKLGQVESMAMIGEVGATKAKKQIVGYVLIAVAVIVALGIGAWWFVHSSLTSMQVMREWLLLYVLIFALVISGGVLVRLDG